MASHLKIPATGSKAGLVDSIIAKMSFISKARDLKSNLVDDGEQRDGQDDDDDPALPGARFMKNKNTNFRLLNLLLKYPAELQRTNFIADRLQLQNMETGSNNNLPIRVRCR
jgi:hypothetical protein